MGRTTVDKVGQLEGLYQIAGDEVRAFLAERPETVEFLVEARPHIEEQFGQDVAVVLSVPPQHPENHEEYLLALIQCEQWTVNDRRLDRFWDEWWCEASAAPRASEVTFGTRYSDELAA